MKNKSLFLFVVNLCLILVHTGIASDLKLWYEEPAKDWMREALPIGNGRLGAMIFGDIAKERIQFNEDSLWMGDESDTGAYQAFGDLYIELEGSASFSGSYRRELDLARGLHTITYERQGIQYKREYFASYPNQVLVSPDGESQGDILGDGYFNRHAQRGYIGEWQ